jgi:hypothetical protein
MYALCNGIQLVTRNADCNRLAIKSSVQTSWNPTYKTRSSAASKKYEIGIGRNEILVISLQDPSGHAIFDLKPLGDKAGALVAQGDTMGTKTLRVGTNYRYELKGDRSIILRSTEITFRDGTRPG